MGRAHRRSTDVSTAASSGGAQRRGRTHRHIITGIPVVKAAIAPPLGRTAQASWEPQTPLQLASFSSPAASGDGDRIVDLKQAGWLNWRIAERAPSADEVSMSTDTAIASNGHERLVAVNGSLSRSESRSVRAGARCLAWLPIASTDSIRVQRWPRMAIAMLVVLVAYASWQVFRWGPSNDRETIADVFFYVVTGAAV